MQVKNILEDETIQPDRSVLLVGPSGSLKTTTASLFPEPHCWIASNPGQMCGFPMHVWERIKKNKDNYVIKAVNTPYRDMMDFVNQHDTEFATWIVDDMTYLQHVFLTEKKGGKTKATYDDWGFILEWSRDIVKLTSEIKGHQVLIALEQVMKDEVEGKILGLPHVFGKFAHDLPALVRTALHITAQHVANSEPKRFVHATPDLVWNWCKDREGLLKPKEEHPDWLIKFLDNGEKNNDDGQKV